MSELNDPTEDRAAFLPVMLACLLGFFFVVLLLLLTGGLLFWLVLVVGGMTGLCIFHYLLWGKAMSEQVAGEREEYELLERARDDREGQSGIYRR
jgi:hypothetical protein